MNTLPVKRILVFALVFSLGIIFNEARSSGNGFSGDPEKGFYGESQKQRDKSKIKKPRSATRAKKAQEAKDKKLKQDYVKSVKASQKRSYKIQTPDVQARMKQNMKDISAKNKAKKKMESKSNRNAGRKYNK
jgi:hypothetical protein